jgi:hypothetical protein
MNVFKSLVSLSVLAATVSASMFTQVNIQANSTIPTFKVGMASASAANFEDYFQDGNVVSLYNNGQAVNLHFLNKGGMINSHNPNGSDDDQKFLVIRKPGTNQVQLQRVGTNFIITPKEYGHLVPLEAWLRSATIPFHSMQTWYVDMVPNSDKVWFRPVGGVPYSMNLPLGQFNRKLTTATFNPNDPDQKFGVQVWSRRNVPPVVQPQAQVVQPPVVQPIVQPQVQQTVAPKPPKWNGPCVNSMTICETSRYTRREGERYVAILAALRTGNQYQGTNPLGQVGHAAFGVAKVWNDVTIARMSNNTEKEVSRKYSYDDNLFTTVSAPGFRMEYATKVNTDWERELIAQWFTNQAPRVNQLSFRALTISEATFKKFASTSKGGYSSKYISGKCYVYTGLYLGVPGTCNCVTISTNLFKQATGESYTHVSSQVPLFLAQSIDKNNGLSDWGR